MIQAFISGQTDLMVVGNDVGAQVLARQEALKPEQKFQLLTSPSHIGLNQGEEALKTAVNDAVAEDARRRQARTRARETWLQVPLDPGQPQGLSRCSDLEFGWLTGALGDPGERRRRSRCC